MKQPVFPFHAPSNLQSPMSRLLPIAAASALFCIAACQCRCSAGLITFDVSGVMNDASAIGGWSAGDPFTSSYTFESTASGAYNPYVNATQYVNALTAFSFTVAGQTYDWTPATSSSDIIVQNDFFSTERYIVTASSIYPPWLPAGVHIEFIQFDLNGSGQLLPNESLVTSAGVLDAFENKSGRVVFSNGSQPSLTVQSIIANTPVPEIDPAGIGSVIALITAALGLLERRRARGA